MKSLATGFLTAAAILASAPVAFAGEYFVPPSNSAATQYTQEVPTAGGSTDTSRGTEIRAPKHVLGKNNAAKLDAQGPEGQAAAELAAATAPTTVSGSENGSEEKSSSDGKKHSSSGGGGGGGKGSGGGGGGQTSKPISNAEPAGSGGLGEVIGKVTGLSTNLLVPLLILAAIAWSIFYVVRQRRTGSADPTPHS